MKKLIIDKTGLFPKKIYKYTDKNNFNCVMKISDINICREYDAYKLLEKINASKYFVPIYGCMSRKGKYIIYSKFIDDDLHSAYKKINKEDRYKFWNDIFIQLADLICILEKNKIQHNDFHMGNLRIELHDNEYFIKIIDLETMVDYKNKIVYPKEVIHATKYEKIRMGWSSKFHVGVDLNQMMGEIINNYKDDIPNEIVDKIGKLIIEEKKEFPFSISYENINMSGKNVLRILKQIS
jgi:hypothetical protein